MKLKRLLPLVLIAPLLASCSGEKVNEPKFESYSNKVEYASYKEALTNAISSINVAKEDASLNSSEVSMLTAYEQSTKANFQCGVDTYGFEKEEEKYEYDANNHLAKELTKFEEEASIKLGDDYESNKHTYTEYESHYQNETVEEVNSIVRLEAKSKKFGVISPVIADYAKEFEAIAILAVRSMLNFEDLMCPDYETLPDEEKAKLSFYQDDKVFTVIYENKMEEKMFDTSDPTKEIGVEKIDAIAKIQGRVEENKVELRYYSDSSHLREYSVSGSVNIMGDDFAYKAGETYEVHQKAASEIKFAEKDVSLSKEDISQYVLA